MSASEGADAVPSRPAEQRSPGALTITLLGRMSVLLDDVDVTPRGPTQRRLIVALALAARRGEHLPIDALAEAVYGENPPPRPRRSLATIVWRLRARWGQVIVSDQYGYWLDTDRCTIDAVDFESTLHQGSLLDRAGDAAAATAALERALSMWRSTENAASVLPAAETDRLTELRLGAMERLGDLLAGAGRTGAAIELLEQVTDHRPVWEHGQALLIGCHLTAGSTADAHRVGDRARRALAEQGLEPGPELSRAIGRLNQARPPGRGTGSSDDARQPGRVPHPRAPVGRAAECATVSTALSTAIRTRTSSVVVVSGEAGIGKSTLVGAAVSALTRTEGSVRTLTLQCDPRRTLPYAVFAPLVPAAEGTSPLAQLLAGDAAAAPAMSTQELHLELAGRVRALAQPPAGDPAAGLVLVVEDLHWAPSGTAEVLATLLDLAGPLPMAVIITTRRRSTARPLAAHTAHRVRLTGLPLEAVAELIGPGADHDRAAAVRRLTGGNPLYLGQLRRTGYALAAELPDDLRAAIDGHLQILPADVRATLRLAAALGDRVDLTTLAALTGELRRDLPTWRTHLRAAATHGLVRPDPEAGERYDFVHTLIREHLYRELSADAQTGAHAAIAHALTRLARSRPYPADLLAHHYTRGWPQTSTAEVVEHLTAAAQAAAAQLDFAQAATHYRSALDHLAMDPEHASHEDTARLLGAAAGACAAAGQTEPANELYRSQLRLATEVGMPRWRMFAALGTVRTHYARRVGAEVTDPLVAAVVEACDTGIISEVPALTGDALAAIQVYRPGRADELLTTATNVAEDLGGRLRTAIWEHQQPADQLATARLLVADPSADPVSSWLRLWVSEVATGRRALDDQPPCPVPVTEADEATRFDLTQWRIATTIATGQLERGRRLIAEALAASAHPDPAENARRAASFYGQRTYLALVTDDLDTAQASPVLANPTWASRHPIMRYVRTYMQVMGGAGEQAWEHCQDLLEEVRDQVIPDSDIVPRVLLLARACVRAGYRPGLEPCLDQLAGHRGEHGIFRFGQYWGSVDGTLGRLRESLGDLDGAIDDYRDAVDGYQSAHAYLDLHAMRRTLAGALEHRGRPGDLRRATQLRASA